MASSDGNGVRAARPRELAPPAPPSNEELAQRLEEVAVLLEGQDANPYRVRAWRKGAETLRALERPAHAILDEEDLEGLDRLPAIGDSLARAIAELARTGKLGLLERLRGEHDGPEAVLTTVPGIGPELAQRIHEELGIEDLVDLEAAAHDGRLDGVHGMGRRRVRAVRESLAGRRHGPDRPRRRSRRPGGSAGNEIPVSEILEVDREYREKAAGRRLPRIAPRRFNPTAAAWLPILHTQRGERHYTALYSNTARAHELGTTRDWVVVYRDDPGGRGQWTVVTARYGALAGERIVRGREDECRALHAAGEQPPA